MAKCPVAAHLQMSCSHCVLHKGGQCCAANYAGYGFHLGQVGRFGGAQFVRLVVTASGQQTLPTARQSRMQQRRAPYKVGV